MKRNFTFIHLFLLTTKKIRPLSKKGVLFSIATLILMLSLLTLSFVYLERTQTSKGLDDYGSRIRYITDDVVSLSYSLMHTSVDSISKDSETHIALNFTITPNVSYAPYFSTYKSFVENTYSKIQHANIMLYNFSNDFLIMPYGTNVSNSGSQMVLYFKSNVSYLNSISVVAYVDGINSSICSVPNNDGSQYPLVTVQYVYLDGSCTNSVHLDPSKNNGNVQFTVSTINQTGTFSIRFGQISTKEDNMLIIESTGIPLTGIVNISYDTLGVVQLKGGSISVDGMKPNPIILSDETLFYR